MSRTLPNLTHLAYPSQTPLNSLKWQPPLAAPQDNLLDRLADFGRKRPPPWRPRDSAHLGAIASTDPLASNAPSAPQHTLSDGAITGGAETTPTAPPAPSHLTLVVTETLCQNCGGTSRQPGNAFLAFYSPTSASVNRDASDMERFEQDRMPQNISAIHDAGHGTYFPGPCLECEEMKATLQPALPRTVSVRHMSVPFCEQCWNR